MSKGGTSYTRIGNSESHVEDNHKKHIREERFKMCAALAVLITVTLLGVALGTCVKQYNSLHAYNGRGGLVLSLSQAAVALLREGSYSCYYVEGSLSSPGTVIDREQVAPLLALHAATQEAFTRSIEMHGAQCNGCPSILDAIGYSDLVTIQNEVLRRDVKSMDVFNFYSEAALKLVRTLNFYVGLSVGEGVADMMWFEDLLLATRSMGATALVWMDQATIPPEIIFTSTASSIVYLDAISTTSAALTVYQPDSTEEFTKAISIPIDKARKMISEVDVDVSGLQSQGEEPLKFVGKLLDMYADFLEALNETKGWDTTSYAEWVVLIGLCAIALGFCVILVALFIYDSMSIVWAADRELHKINAVNRLQFSLTRISRFMRRVYDLDQTGLCELAEQSMSSSSSTILEREFAKLQTPVCQVLSFIHPCILARRIENPAIDADPNERMTSKAKHSNMDSVDPAATIFQMGLSLQALCVLIIDIRGFFCEVTAESFKSLPKEITMFIGDVSTLAKRCGGTLLQLAGTALIFGWSEETNDNCHNAACSMLYHMRGLLRTYPHICCAVVSSVSLHGVVGGPGVRSYVCVSSMIRKGRLLIQMARLHGSVFVSDSATFMKLDSQRFRKRALEKVALFRQPNANDGKDGFTVFELSLAAEGSPQSDATFLWNDAFDSFHSGYPEEGLSKLLVVEERYGKTQSVKRINRIASERPTVRPLTYLYTDGVGFDLQLVLWNLPSSLFP